jgi:hypothetical protein
MDAGPNREPVRKEQAVSKGIPITAKSTSSVVWTLGKRINVLTPQNLGDSNEFVG